MLDLWVPIIAFSLAFLVGISAGALAAIGPTLQRIADALEAIADGERGEE